MECKGQRARRRPREVEVCISTSDRHLLVGRGRREARRGPGNHFCSYRPSKGSWSPFLSDMAKVHEPVEQAAEATLSQAGNFLTRKVEAQERACTNRPSVLMWHQKPSIKAPLVSMASKESSWLRKHGISDQACRGTAARGGLISSPVVQLWNQARVQIYRWVIKSCRPPLGIEALGKHNSPFPQAGPLAARKQAQAGRNRHRLT